MSRFQTTRWSIVLQARDGEPHARSALAELCRTYRPPVLAYIRGRGYASEDAEDLAQAFFARLLEHSWHATADSERGRFRAFLLTLLKRFLIEDSIRVHARKRGGDVRFEAFEEDTDAITDADTPDRAFERAWSMAVLHAAIGHLQAEATQAGKEDLFLALREFLVEPPDEADYARAAERLGLRRNTLAVAVHRMRHRLRELVQREIEQTTTNDSDYELEMRDMRAALDTAMRDRG